MEIDGRQQKQLRDALLSAFPTRDSLESMVLYGSNENLSAIAGGGGLEHTVFELIRWAIARGRLEELLLEALNQNPKSPQLIRIVQQFGLGNNQPVTPIGTSAAGQNRATPPPVYPVRSIDRQELNNSQNVLKAFICYATNENDKPFAKSLSQTLENCGIDTWMYSKNVVGGMLWEEQIEAIIPQCDLLIACLSRDFLYGTGFRHAEVNMALKVAENKSREVGDIFIVPLVLERFDKIPHQFRKYDMIEYYKDAQDGFHQLMLSLEHKRQVLKQQSRTIPPFNYSF